MSGQDDSGTLDGLTFDNRFVRELPGDPEVANLSRQVMGACYSRVDPLLTAAPRKVAHSREMAERLGLSPETCESPDFARVFSGNRQLKGMEPFASCYGGHQFGNWAGQLGDGRVINLGEVVTPSPDSSNFSERWMLHGPQRRGPDGRFCWSRVPPTVERSRVSGEPASSSWTGVTCPTPR